MRFETHNFRRKLIIARKIPQVQNSITHDSQWWYNFLVRPQASPINSRSNSEKTTAWARISDTEEATTRARQQQQLSANKSLLGALESLWEDARPRSALAGMRRAEVLNYASAEPWCWVTVWELRFPPPPTDSFFCNSAGPFRSPNCWNLSGTRKSRAAGSIYLFRVQSHYFWGFLLGRVNERVIDPLTRHLILVRKMAKIKIKSHQC